MTGIVVANEVELKHLHQDLAEIKKWARNVLYNKVKFLYRGEQELESTSEKKGMVYQMYVEECQDKLTGVIASESVGPEYKLIYKRLLWQRATNESIIARSLSSGRSSSYTSMQNRFDGKLSIRPAGYWKNHCLHVLLPPCLTSSKNCVPAVQITKLCFHLWKLSKRG